MTIQEIINEIFKSQEMKDYLCENTEKLYKHDKKEMIAGSPIITVQRKLEMLEWLAEDEDLEQELAEVDEDDEREREFVIWYSYAEIVKNTREALAAFYDTSKPAIFLVRFVANWGEVDDEDKEVEQIPFTSYEKAVQYMRKQEEQYGEYRIWFDIEKWEQDEDGNLEQKWGYVVVKEQVIYFYHPENFYNECAPDKDVNLPIPFNAGDIIEVEDMPFARKRHVLILDIGDNKDCCAVFHLYVDEDGYIKANAFKHGHMLFGCSYATSPLYSAKTFRGVLEGEEEVLYIVQQFVNKIPEDEEKRDQLYEIFDYVRENQIHSRDITEELLEDIRDKVPTGKKVRIND